VKSHRRFLSLRAFSVGIGFALLGCLGPDGAGKKHGSGSDGDSSGGASTSSPGAGGSTIAAGSGGAQGGGASSGGSSGVVAGPGSLPVPPLENDPVTLGATITYLNIGEPGWYPSRRDPASGECDAVNNGSCCMTQYEYSSELLAPWDEDLIMQLRGPMLVERLAVYQPAQESGDGSAWNRVAIWDNGGALDKSGVVFGADGVEGSGLSGSDFDGAVGSTCVIDVMNEQKVPCGSGSVPYCEGADKQDGFSGSKLFIVLAKTPRMSDPQAQAMTHCAGPTDNWYDAPWIGLTHGELVRSGKFGGCHCYAKNPDEWWLGDGCGQFNVFEVINDNNEYTNLEVFSTNIFGPEYIGGGPCPSCSFASLPNSVELVSKWDNSAAITGETTEPGRSPGYAIRRPTEGYRYFVVLLDVASRTIQTGIIHPARIPESVGALLPGLPEWVGEGVIHNLRDLRLPE
jgi:hypothetical protein